MRQLRLLAALPVLAGIGFLAPSHVSAAGHHTNAPIRSASSIGVAPAATPFFTYDISAWDEYCTQTAPSACTYSRNPVTHNWTFPSDLMFGDAEAYGMPGQVAGRPGGVYFECDKNYTNFGNGGYSSQYEYVYVGTTTPVYGAFDNGYITAGSYATLGPRYLTEVEGQPSNSPAAFGQMNVSAYDADTSTYATVTGINYANEFQLTANSPEINLISSVVPNPGFTIHMSGNLYQYIPGRGTVVLGQNVPITCTAGAHVGAISNPSGYMRYGYPDDQYAENAYELFNNRD